METDETTDPDRTPDPDTIPDQDVLTLYVCITCRGADAPEDETRPGARLHRALAHALADPDSAGPRVRIEPVACLSGCKRACTIALSGPGRWTYVYGDLDPEGSIETILDGIRRYGAASNGLIPWRERPEAFRKGAIARIPPLPPSTDPRP